MPQALKEERPLSKRAARRAKKAARRAAAEEGGSEENGSHTSAQAGDEFGDSQQGGIEHLQQDSSEGVELDRKGNSSVPRIPEREIVIV